MAKFRAPAAKVKHQVRARMHRRKLLNGNMTPDAQYRELAALVEQRIVAE